MRSVHKMASIYCLKYLDYLHFQIHCTQFQGIYNKVLELSSQKIVIYAIRNLNINSAITSSTKLSKKSIQGIFPRFCQCFCIELHNLALIKFAHSVPCSTQYIPQNNLFPPTLKNQKIGIKSSFLSNNSLFADCIYIFQALNIYIFRLNI